MLKAIKSIARYVARPGVLALQQTKRVAVLSKKIGGVVSEKAVRAARGDLAAAVKAEIVDVPPAPPHIFVRLRRLARVAQVIAAVTIAFTAYWLAEGDGNILENTNFVVFAILTVSLAVLTAFMVKVA
ncbi:MAG: hypothetical protein ING19_18955, partial [Azospirillum sp.]|nr:hypothetical protein [Azospirillum sp.]